jgi:hypothetical protein
MKKIIGVGIILLTLILAVIYRQLTHRPARQKPEKTFASASLREGVLLSYLMLN